MDTISALQELGFTEYEAKVYCALIRFPGSTGYEIGGHSKVPRARVYEVLEGLEEKGMVYPQTVGGKQLYYPKPHGTMLAERKERLTRVADIAQATLDAMASDAPEPEFLVFTGKDHVFARIRQLCRQTEVKLLVSGWPEDLMALGPELARAHEHGAGVYVVCLGEAKLPIPNVFYHSVSPLQYVQVAVFGRWLQVVSDLKECFIGQILGPDRSLGLWSKGAALAFTVAQWIYHDITVLALQRELEAEATARISPETRVLLRSVLQWPPDGSGNVEVQGGSGTAGGPGKPGQSGSPGSKVELPDGAPDVAGIFAGIERRLKADPASARDIEGRYEFRLSGEGGGVFHVALDAGLVRVGEGPLMEAVMGSAMDPVTEPMMEPDLVLEASSEDFRALVLGVLPLGALYTPGRIKVRGSIEAASRIQSLLRG